MKKKYSVPKYRLRYTAEFKHQVCREYVSGQYSKSELQEKYGIKGKSRLLDWLNELGYSQYIRENAIKIMRKNRVLNLKKTKHIQQGSDSERIKNLEKALQDAQLKAAAYNKMIEIAEQEYKIKIRKNLNTK